MINSMGKVYFLEGRYPLTYMIKAQRARASDWILITSEDLPTLPHVAARALALLGNPLCTAAQIEAVVRTDISLAQRILRMSNSVMFGGASRITDIKSAVVRLGFNRIKNLVLIAATKDVMAKAGNLSQDLWRHSLGVALCTSLVLEAMGKKANDDIFLGGLFHDVGKVLIANQKPERYGEIIEISCAQRRLLSTVEKEVFNFTHEEVGVLILKKWNFPDNLITAVKHHHCIQEESCGAVPDEKSVAIVSTSDLIAAMLNIGIITSVTIDPVGARSTRLLGLGEEAVLAIVEKLPELFLSEVSKFE
jgi:putative nucleotidyltransferase with HDIG domain